MLKAIHDGSSAAMGATCKFGKELVDEFPVALDVELVAFDSGFVVEFDAFDFRLVPAFVAA